MWAAVSLIIGMYCSWQFVAPRFRMQTEYLDCCTMPSYLVKRFQDSGNAIRLVSSFTCILFLTYYVAAGLISIGLLFESVFSIDYMIGTLTATCVMLGYIFIGGFVSVAWVDLFQAIFLLFCIIIVPIFAYQVCGGFATIEQKAEAAKLSLNLFSKDASWKDMLYPLLGWGFGYFGMPHIITKFMGIEKPTDLVKSKYLGITWQIIALLAAASVGLIGIAYFSNTVINSELVFILMVKDLFHPLTAGFILCGLLAAVISTMDSQLLVATSVLTEDIFKHHFPNLSEKKSLFVFRISALVIAACAFLISLSKNTTIMEAVYYAWAGLGTSFAPVVLASLYSNRITKNGALASISFGCLFSISWPTLNKFLYTEGILDAIPSMAIGFPLSLAILFVVSHFDSRRLQAVHFK